VVKKNLKKGQNIHSKMEPNTLDNGCPGRMIRMYVTDKELRLGPMVLGMKVLGSITKLTGRVLFGTCMVINTKESGKTIRPMVMEFTPTPTVLSMKETGLTIYNMDGVLNNGLMGVNMKEITKPAENMAKAVTCGLMDLSTLAIGLKIKSMAVVVMNG
jgi:hypothetical protein